jgi:hypothetical protein
VNFLPHKNQKRSSFDYNLESDMSTILSSVLFASSANSESKANRRTSFKKNKRQSLKRSNSSKSNTSKSNSSSSSSASLIFFSKKTQAIPSKVAIGPLPFQRFQDNYLDETKDDNLSKIGYFQEGKQPSAEYCGSFYKRFGDKPCRQRKNVSFFKSSHENTFWNSVVQKIWECTLPTTHQEEEWFEEVPFQRDGYLDIRHENGEWHFWEESSHRS